MWFDNTVITLRISENYKDVKLLCKRRQIICFFVLKLFQNFQKNKKCDFLIPALRGRLSITVQNGVCAKFDTGKLSSLLYSSAGGGKRMGLYKNDFVTSGSEANHGPICINISNVDSRHTSEWTFR